MNDEHGWSVVFALVMVGCTRLAPAAEPARSGALAQESRGPVARPGLPEARQGVSNRELGDLLEDHWYFRLRSDPLEATAHGLHDFDREVADESEPAEQRRDLARDALLGRARAFDAASFEASDQETLQLLTANLEAERALRACGMGRWNASVFNNPIQRFGRVAKLHPLASQDDVATLLARLDAVEKAIDGSGERLLAAAEDGLTPAAPPLSRLIALVERQLMQPSKQWPFVVQLRMAPDSALERAQLEAQVTARVDERLRPALERYLGALRALLPKARTGTQVGLGALPDGAKCYAASIAHHTTLALSASDVHARGREETARIEARIAELGRTLFGDRGVEAVLKRVREDRQQGFPDAASVLEAARAWLAHAQTRLPLAFQAPVDVPLEVEAIDEVEAPGAPLALFRPPLPDGSTPATLRINVHNFLQRPRYLLPVLMAHEGLPGHHLQEAVGRAAEEIPAFRRYQYLAAYIEGWGLYAEDLASELGLYSGPREQLGRLVYDAWRTARLVVDSGLHGLSWSREQAVAYLLAHTALTSTEAEEEVDRYLAMPGQALSYKLGALEIRALRAEVESALSSHFELARFHDVVLGRGPVSLPVLRARVASWLKEPT